MGNTVLTTAKKAKNDEFYTQYVDIEKEMATYVDYNGGVFKDKTVLLPCDDPEWSNFTRFFVDNFQTLGLKKLISTSYGTLLGNGERSKGKIFVMTVADKVDVNDLKWDYLESDGDFRNAEISSLRDSSDFVITNPPFSLFREFLAWVVDGGKQFSIIGNMNAITYKEVFPLIKDNIIWLGATGNGNDMVFRVPSGSVVSEKDKLKAEKLGYVGDYTRLGNSCWFTSIECGTRHEFLKLRTFEENLVSNNAVKDKGYQVYDNYDAVEVPRVDAIPSDFSGVMGVPITFLGKYNPDQFEIVKFRHGDDGKDLRLPDGRSPYFRVLVRHKES